MLTHHFKNKNNQNNKLTMETTPNMNPLKNMGSFIPKKTIIIGLMTIFGLIFFLIINPFSWNDAGNRTVVETYQR
jgi:uncharacterized membrane protein YvbJ